MSSFNHLYLLSNGCEKLYPLNSLTHFSNSLPNPISFEKDENIQVSLEAIGFSCDFRNLFVPDNPKTPSVIVTDIGKYGPYSMKKLIVDKARVKMCMDNYFFDSSKIGDELCSFKTYFLDDLWYTEDNVKQMCEKYSSENLLKWKYQDKSLTITANDDSDYWILVHPSFLENFDFKLELSNEWVDHLTPKTLFSGSIDKLEPYKAIFEQFVNYNGEYYHGFYLNQNAPKLVGKESITITEAKFPEIVKVQSSIITSQILNNKHSKDLVCFCPDFNTESKYYYKEFDQPQKIKLENTTLTNVVISLKDENDRKLQLLPGVPTLVKLKFEKMLKQNKTFNVRLTSNKNDNFPNNSTSVFKVRLPNTLYFNKERNWKVALTSISHPNNFTTFAGEAVDRMIMFKLLDGVLTTNPEITEKAKPKNIPKKFVFENNKNYTKDEIIQHFNELLRGPTEKYGSARFDGEYFELTLSKPSTIIISNNILHMLGHRGVITTNKKVTSFTHIGNEEKIYRFDVPCDLKHLQPQYIIAYCNIVEPTIFGGEYSNILRIVSIPKERSDYVIQEFKNKNFLQLLNTEISEIEINFRTHDGLLVNFAGNYNIIVNLEFSNVD